MGSSLARMFLFGTLLTSALFALVAYVLWRVATVPLLAGRLSRRRLVLLGVGFVVTFFAAQLLSHGGSGRAAAAVQWIGMTLLGTLFLVATALLAADVATGFGLLFRRQAPTLRGAAVVVGLLLSAIALVQGHRAPEVVDYEVTLPSLPRALDGKVAVALADTHLGSDLGLEWFSARIDQVRALRPDLVLFLGDIFEGHGEAPGELAALRSLEAPLGKWFVAGNHESHGPAGNGNGLLEEAGVRRLENAWAEAAPGLVLAGVEDLTNHRRRRLAGDPLGRTLAGRPPGATILLSHTPWEAERAARAGVELMLSGHTHGGQLWPFGLIVRRLYPLLAGRYDVDGMPVLVSRGTGGWGPRMRLWRRAEIMRITLRAPR